MTIFFSDGSSMAEAAGGKILQTIQTTKTDQFSASSASSWTDITGLSVSITPASSSNKILVTAGIAMGLSHFYGFNYVWRMVRGSTGIGVGTNSTSSTNASGGANLYNEGGNVPYLFGNTKQVLDSPSTTSSTTYKVQAHADSGNATIFVNRRGSSVHCTGFSFITVQEVAA